MISLLLINCKLCGYVGEIPGLSDIQGRPLADYVGCPYCGHNTTSKTDLERIRKRDKNAQMFDTLELLSKHPPEEVIKKRIEWAKLTAESGENSKELEILENTPHDIEQLDEKIALLVEKLRREPDWQKRHILNFERKLLCWLKVVLQWQKNM